MSVCGACYWLGPYSNSVGMAGQLFAPHMLTQICWLTNCLHSPAMEKWIKGFKEVYIHSRGSTLRWFWCNHRERESSTNCSSQRCSLHARENVSLSSKEPKKLAGLFSNVSDSHFVRRLIFEMENLNNCNLYNFFGKYNLGFLISLIMTEINKNAQIITENFEKAAIFLFVHDAGLCVVTAQFQYYVSLRKMR